MVRIETLSDELSGVAKLAGDLSRKVRGGGEVPALALAAALVEASKLRGRLAKLASRVDAARDGDGESGKA
jgi:hypothetical protein